MNIGRPLAVALSLVCGTSAYAQQQPAAKPVPFDAATQVNFVALNVSDLDKSIAFYKLVGFTVTMQAGEKPKRQIVFQIDAQHDGGGLVLAEHEGPIEPGSALSRIGIRTADAAAVCKRLADAGMPCVREPRAVPQDQGAIIGMAKDPDGTMLEIVQKPK